MQLSERSARSYAEEFLTTAIHELRRFHGLHPDPEGRQSATGPGVLPIVVTHLMSIRAVRIAAATQSWNGEGVRRLPPWATGVIAKQPAPIKVRAVSCADLPIHTFGVTCGDQCPEKVSPAFT